MFPAVQLPVWIGTMIVVLILLIIMYGGWNSLWERGHSIGMWALVILTALLIIAAVLSILGLVPT